MKFVFQLLAINLISLAAMTANASQVIITCPTAQQVSINTQGTASGYAIRNDGEHRIYLQGDTISHTVKSFFGGEFIDNMLACYYHGNAEDFSIMNYYMSGDIHNCRFNNLTYQCLGQNPQSCQLTCEK